MDTNSLPIFSQYFNSLRPHLARVVLREFPVARRERDELRMLGDVAQHVPGVVAGLRRRRHAQALVAPAAPEVLGPPVPAFHRVGRAHLARVAAQLAHEGGMHAATRMQALGFAVPVLADGQHRIGAVGIDDAPDLAFHDVERLVPADAHELGPAPVGRVDFRGIPARLPVDALQGVADAVLGIHAVLVGQGEVVGRRLHGWAELLAVHLDGPAGRLHLVFGVPFLIVHGADAHDLSVA